jgi:predicted metal-dependent phosphoesterase TrpH
MANPTADLHLHTTYSDGTESPERVIELARAAGLTAAAITDHDNTEAFPRARAACEKHGIEFIPGIEMSAAAQGLEVHILGFLFDPANQALAAHLAEQQQRRVRRVYDTVERLKKVGVNITAEEILALAGEGTVGRPHVARTLLKHGYVNTFAEAFQKYIGPNNPGFVPGSATAPAEIIRLIRGAGGIPVLAHAMYLKNDALIEEFARDGLLGLEVYHSSHGPEEIKRYEALADRLKLMRTGGSDFHGDSKEGVPVGVVQLPYSYYENLKRWKAGS